MAIAQTQKTLHYELALDVCSQWKRAHGRSVISVDDLIQIKEWIGAPDAGISRFPGMQNMAAQGLDELITENYRITPASANLLRI